MKKTTKKLTPEQWSVIRNHYDNLMAGRYHQIYESLGVVKGGRNKNFHCITPQKHSGGVDKNPSMGIDNNTGLYLCYSCRTRGNLSKFIKEHRPDIKYFDFCASQTGKDLEEVINTYFPELQIDLNSGTEEAKKWKELQKKKKEDKVDPNAPIPNGIDMVNAWTQNLLSDEVALDFLVKDKYITRKTISEYGIGFNRDHNAYVFPSINKRGELINVKLYNPFGNREEKWIYPYPGRSSNLPVPFVNLTHKVLYLFEGEPDAYCACSHGIPGSTLGAASKVIIDSMFDEDVRRNLFGDKIIIICLDADKAGTAAAERLAKQLYTYAKEIKIIDLNKSSINPQGLDPELTSINSDGKIVRHEKDFVDFAKKIGFGDLARDAFFDVVKRTPVFELNVDRKSFRVLKVSLGSVGHQEYISHDGSTEVQTMAAIENLSDCYYCTPRKVRIHCPVMLDVGNRKGICKECSLLNHEKFGEDQSVDVEIVTRYQEKSGAGIAKLSPKQVLAYIDTSDKKRTASIMEDLKIPPRCNRCEVMEVESTRINVAHLTTPVSDISDSTEQEEYVGGSSLNTQHVAYILGDMPLAPNKSYIMQGVSTTSPKDQSGCLFVYDITQRETSIDKFRVTEGVVSDLQVFRPESSGESLEDHLEKRYKMYSRASGLKGREDLMFVLDSAYCSPLTIDVPSLLPKISRGYIEVLVGGESRSGKSVGIKFLRDAYQFGGIVTSSGTATEAGLVGGVVTIDKTHTIKWGILPQNDGGVVTIDELSDMPGQFLRNMNNLRSEGVAELSKIMSGKVPARVRKICLSNPRTGMGNKNHDTPTGLDMLLDICTAPQVLSRFDLAYITMAKDVDSDTYESEYTGLCDGYSVYRMQNLIRWVLSREANDFVYEDGFDECVIYWSKRLREVFDDRTQLINAEMPAKLVRCGGSIALRTVSVPNEDYTKVLVKKKHVEYIAKWMMRVYSSNNFKLDVYSRAARKSRELGDMRFMENILRYVDPALLLSTDYFTAQSIAPMFGDYLQRVLVGKCTMVSALSDRDMVSGLHYLDAANRLLSVLIARRCLKMDGNKYVKTTMFKEWLSDMLGVSNDKLSRILETNSKNKRGA